MKKYISLLILPIFLAGFWVFENKTTEIASADIPPQECPTGSMRLAYGDGSTTGSGGVAQPVDPWAPAPAPAPAPGPAPSPDANPVPLINWDSYLDDEVIDKYNRDSNFRENQQLVKDNTFITKAYARGHGEDEDGGGNGGGQALGGGPVCASYRNFLTSVADLACIVMQEQGGGPFCMAPNSNVIYNGLKDNSCRRVPGTQLAGFRIVATFPTYACGVPSPVTDG